MTDAVDNNHQKRNGVLGWTIAALLVVGLAVFAYWFFHLRFHETTDDAYVGGNLININAQIKGTPIAYYADDTDFVEKDQVLVKLDPTNYEIEFTRSQAALALAAQQVRQLAANVEAHKRNAALKNAQYEQAKRDYQNRQGLVSSRAVSQETFEHSQDASTVARLAYEEAQAKLQHAEAALGPTSMINHALILKAKEDLRLAYVNLTRTHILAPTSGVIAKRRVQLGQQVTATTFLLGIVPSDQMWIDANFKEGQLREMRIGQPARVTVDLYGSAVVYSGKVVGISSGTGAVFSLLPPQNATGNWIKIVQRLPVRIALPLDEIARHPLRLGLSCHVDVNTTDRGGPIMAHTPSFEAIASTDVYDRPYADIDALSNSIIDQYLRD